MAKLIPVLVGENRRAYIGYSHLYRIMQIVRAVEKPDYLASNHDLNKTLQTRKFSAANDVHYTVWYNYKGVSERSYIFKYYIPVT